MSESKYRLAKIIIAIGLLVVLYLFALNERYEIDRSTDDYLIDKWTQKFIKITF
jgi:hypothetical protein